MVSFTSLPLEIIWSRFLGLQSRVILAGNLPNEGGSVQILDLIPITAEDNDMGAYHPNSSNGDMKAISAKSTSYSADKYSVTACELGGITRLNQTFVALALYDHSNSHAKISIVQILSTADEISMALSADLTSTNTSSSFQSITFHSDSELLSAANEDGIITTFSLESMSEVHSFVADATGYNKIHYLSSGQLVTLGKSNGLKVWDLHNSQPSGLFNRIKPIQEMNIIPLCHNELEEISAFVENNAYEQFIVGTTLGNIFVIDVRSNRIAYAHKVHNKRVTDIRCHPYDPNIIISVSADSSIKYTSVNGPMESLKNQEVLEIVSEFGGFMTSVDCIRGIGMSSAMGVCSSNLGGVWMMELI